MATVQAADFVQTCKALFEEADKDSSGALDADEFVSVLQDQKLKLHLTKRELDNMRKLADTVRSHPLPPLHSATMQPKQLACFSCSANVNSCKSAHMAAVHCTL